MDVKPEFEMKILFAPRERGFMTGFPKTVMLPDSCREIAMKNHGQTLERLNDRGGLGLQELVGVMKDMRRSELLKVTVFDIVDCFREYHWVDQ